MNTPTPRKDIIYRRYGALAVPISYLNSNLRGQSGDASPTTITIACDGGGASPTTGCSIS